MEPGLYLVATPIGELRDLSARARQVLEAADVVAAEDTRTTRRLFRELELPTPPMVSYHDHNEQQRVPALLQRLEAGERVALVSDAGTPLISDPGYRLVQAAAAAGVRVVPVPGPCAAVAALSASGLPTDRFVFLGFLPRSEGKRGAALEGFRGDAATLVLYEAPHRIRATLRTAREQLGDRPACLAISLTKVWERFHRGSLADISRAMEDDEEVIGEMTLVIGGASGEVAAEQWERAERLIARLVALDIPASAVRDAVCEAFDLPRREVYQAVLRARA